MKRLASIVCALSLALVPVAVQADTAAGKAIYDKSCASCHGADGRGNADKAKLLKIDAATLNLGRDEVASQTKDEKKAITMNGKARMPAYGKKMSEADVDSAMDYVMELIAAIRGKK